MDNKTLKSQYGNLRFDKSDYIKRTEGLNLLLGVKYYLGKDCF